MPNKNSGNYCIVVGNKTVDLTTRPRIMGVLNVTPDSFSDGGRFFDPGRAVEHALGLDRSGADLIDVGGESSRPGAEEISAGEELRRVLPVVKALRGKTKKLISVDTSKASVAEAALDAGADLVNDISALTHDPGMGNVVAKAGCPVVLMHMKGLNARDMQRKARYRDLMGEIILFLRQAIKRAKRYGIDENKIIVDPGIGFGKTAGHNLEIINRLSDLLKLSRPILIGASRKSFIGKILGGVPADKRLAGSLASAAVAVMNGAHIIRAHDVAETRGACEIAYQIMKAKPLLSARK